MVVLDGAPGVTLAVVEHELVEVFPDDVIREFPNLQHACATRDGRRKRRRADTEED